MAAEDGVTYLGSETTDGEPPWSVVELPIPETIGFVPSMRCFPRAWAKSPPAWSDDGEMREVQVESVEFGDRFDARVDATQEENWLRQLLSPDFVAWLTESPQSEFGFEVHEGVLRCFTPGHLRDADAQRLVAESTHVADRVRSEALESEGLGVRELGSGVPERIERAVAKVAYPSLPPDSKTASLPFRPIAARDPRVYLAALGGVVSVFTTLFVLLLQADVNLIEIAIHIVDWIGPKNTGIGIAALALAGWIGAIPGAIAVASHSYGRVAFVREYARARGLRLESPQSFHRRLMRVELPAPAEFVLRGNLEGVGHGRLVLCRSRRGPFANYFDAVVADTPDGAEVLLSRPARADHTARELDGVISDAAQRAKATAQTSTSSTSPSGS